MRRPVDTAAGGDGRRQCAARVGAAPVRHHRTDGRAARSADAARPRSPHLLQGGGRRARDGRLRAEPAAVGHACAGRLRVPPARPRLGALRADDGARRRPRAGTRRRRDQPTRQRARELHARRHVHPRRGTRVAQLLRRRRLQRLRYRRRRRCRHGARRVGRQRRTAVRPLAGRHPPLRPPAPQRRVGPHAHARGVRQALHDGLAVRGARQRSPVPPLAALRPLAAAGRVLRREARLGAPELVRRRRRRRGAARPLQLRPPELVRGGRSRARRDA